METHTYTGALVERRNIRRDIRRTPNESQRSGLRVNVTEANTLNAPGLSQKQNHQER